MAALRTRPRNDRRDPRRQTARTAVPCAASCCARAGCPRRSSARSTRCCPGWASRMRRNRSTSRPHSAASRRSSWKSASAWARRRQPSPRRIPQHDFLGLEVHGPGVGALLNRVDAAGLDQRARDPARRRRRRRAHDSAGVAGRHPRLFSRSVAQEAPSQAAPAAARVRARARAAAGARRLPARGDGLGRLRAGNPRDASARAAAREYRRRFRAATGVAAADQIRGARPASSATACATSCSARR